MAGRWALSARGVGRTASHQRLAQRNVGLRLGEYGQGLRSSVSGKHVALFGATHNESCFLARYLCAALGKEGSRVRVGNHGCELETRHLKVCFDLGQFAAPFYSPRDADSMRRVIGHSNIVINAIANYYETGNAIPTRRPPDYSWRSLSTVNYSHDEAHCEVARTLARVAKEAGVECFVHVSASYADLDSPSPLARSKAKGELAVLEEFPEAIIVRPTTMFGCEDRFLNWFACSYLYFGGLVPLVEDGAALVQPVYVQDVADLISEIVADPDNFEGRTFVVGGPAEYTRREMAEFVFDVTKQPAWLVDCPTVLAKAVASVIEFLPEPHITNDDVVLHGVDAVAPAAGTSDYLGFDHVDITPTPIEKIAFSYLHRFRKGGHFVLAKGYHDGVINKV